MRATPSSALLLVPGLIIALAACGDSGTPADAAVKKDGAAIDGTPGVDAAIDAPAGNACTGATYDPCTLPAQCMSGICHLFNGAALQVCTPSCTPGAACPSQGGVTITCNNMGFCKPPAANNCTR